MLRATAIVFLTLSTAIGSLGSRILFIAGTPSYSHQVVFQPIWRELSLRGHQVTVLTTNPLEDPALANLTEIDLGFSYAILAERFMERLVTEDDSSKFAMFFLEVLSVINEEQLSHPQVKRLIENDTVSFDLVMVEYLLPTMLIFGSRFKCPIIALTSLDATLIGQFSMGNSVHPALNPDNVLKLITYWLVIKHEDAVIAEHFGDGYPSLTTIMKNVDMFFMNVNPAFHNIRATVPAVVHIGGGMHFQPPKPLPEDLKVYLDEAKEGVIYFSLGTNVRTTALSQRFLEAITSALAEVPYKVLWKCDGDLPSSPPNILARKWLPQHDILRHPNVKLFITQGGLQSIEETMEARVPIIVFPSFADQFSNAVLVERRGFGVKLDHRTADKELIKKTILEVVGNSTYKKNVEKMAKIAVDQPMTGLEKAIWWTEYVLRHKGAKHLRNPAIDMPFHQFLLLDVIAFSLFFLVVIGFTVTKTVKFCYFLIEKHLCQCRQYGKNKSEKQN